MARIFTVGESLIDIIFRNEEPVSAKAGGSMLNTAVSLGRLGTEIFFVSDFGRDKVGDMIQKFLNENQVNTDFIQRYEHFNSPVALAFLDKSNDASYLFYKNLLSDRLNEIKIDFEENDILLFGSFFAISDSVRKSLLSLLISAHEAGAIIIYDPNFRRPHLHEIERVRPMIIENMHFADIVRGSDEDFDLIFGSASADEAYARIRETGCGNLVYTSNKNGVDIRTFDHNLHLDVPAIETVSTIGAGDNFNAGLLWTILRNEFSKKDLEHLPVKHWQRMGQKGIAFATDVCLSYDNYISVEFAVKVLKEGV